MAMVAISFHLKLRGHKLTWLLAALVLAAIIGNVGLYHLDSFPATFIQGTGVTQFKTNFEYVLFIGNSVLALIFLKQCNRCETKDNSIGKTTFGFVNPLKQDGDN